MSQQAEEGRIAIPPAKLKLEWDPQVAKGQYANTVTIIGSSYEVILDFSFRGAVPGLPGQIEGGHNLHIARIVLTLRAAQELRDVLNRSIPSQGGT
jgi:hypothetical protein